MANIWVDNENIGVGLPAMSAKKRIPMQNGNPKQSAKKSVLSKIDNLMHQKHLAATPLKTTQTNCSGFTDRKHVRHEVFKTPAVATTSKANNKDFLFDYQDHPKCFSKCNKRIAEQWSDNQLQSDDLFHQLFKNVESSFKTVDDVFNIPKSYIFDDDFAQAPDLWDTKNRSYYNVNDNQLNQMVPMPNFDIC